ncbi:nitrate ABC transporter permease [Synechococcus elongatus]|uniref:Bicarbonate transport system permease protein CmpB n=2 Tax=Synechococcus elongatus TaxID=32046 RepID=CMPB_SYNE7|nr:nitrate ABC transporter permease [Synechococcus elongatus]Q55106.1 RecName: Full=Bicarbonate transport system permease protein CmpB [Synechococcus elongatus PCC 7942 = FACHB-805]Q5MZ55.1 RecName: Full=Bicarbonate transport system permease protein CmpB [Synechococcus elongatus PCC 6301]ABB57519.1 nitrate transport permease [Synechococcus elongatus PCC 7942 = FACHB-805]AJD57867.1 bicarbonate transporter permease [Synechococcus elongatus UTEX 2973]MBD2588322.1 nitrate ABC transporter permease 
MVTARETRRNGSRPSGLKKWRQKLDGILLPLAGILGFLIIWQIFSSSGATRLPGPLSLFTEERTRELLLYPFLDRGGLDKGLFWQTIASLTRVAQGFSIAAIIGISVGILVGLNRQLNAMLDPLFQFLRMIAPLAWVPIALVAFQQNQPAAIFVIFITAVWPILINTAEGVRQIPQDYNNVARVLRMSKSKYLMKVVLPAALPYIFTGLRIAIGLSWLAIIAAEIVMSGIVGIGFFIWDAYQQNYVSDIILAVIYIGAVGLLLDRFVAWLQRWILRNM